MKRILPVLLTLLLVTACQSTPPPDIETASPPTATPTNVTVVLVTATAIDTPPPTTEAAPPQPTQTPTLAPTATPAAAPSPSPTPEPPLTGVVTGNPVNLRSGPDTGYALIAEASLSQTVTITGQNDDHSWWQIELPENPAERAWIFADLLQTDLEADDIAARVPVVPFPPELVGSVVRGNINVRSGPGTGFPQVGQAGLGESVTIVGRDEANVWWQVCCPTGTGQTSWLAREFLATNVSPAQAKLRLPVTSPGLAGQATVSVTGTLTGSVAGLVTGDWVNLRSGPGTDTEIIGAATLSQTVQIISADAGGEWLEVCCLDDGASAWITAEFVQTSESLPQTAAIAPTPGESPAETDTPAAQPAAIAPDEDNALPGSGGFGPPGGSNPLTGLPLSADKRARRPVIVCINNDPIARPQYGLSQADVMVEYLMEGYGITRFSGIFYGDDPARIGPVRSARLVNYYMGALYNAPLMCSGASDEVRFLLKNQAPFPYLDIDLDDPSNRRYSTSLGTDYRTRLNTSAAGLEKWLSDWEIAQPASVRGFSFGDLPDGGQPATRISIDYPAVTGSNVDYAFDAAGGRYLRFLGDDPHTDAATGRQLALDNVVVQVVPHVETDMVEDSLGSKGIRLNLFGSGPAIVFRDGQAFAGTWASASRGDTPHFFDTTGREVPLKPGRTWISIVPSVDEALFGG